MSRLLLAFILGFLIVINFGCQKMSLKNGLLNPSSESDGIFATRPQNLDVVLLTLKLKGEPVFIRGNNPLIVANKKLTQSGLNKLKEIHAEQSQLEKQLSELSSEIKVIYRLKYVVNALVVAVPAELAEKVNSLNSVSEVIKSSKFGRPVPFESSNPNLITKAIDLTKTSVNFIGAEKAWAKGIRGQGLKVGVIDTGIDFTHNMLGGSGNSEDFANMDKSLPTSLYPNEVVVGGYDFVGTTFNAASTLASEQIPLPDINPMDEGGHGTHVAGSIAGRGDNVNTYDGVAPDAKLYSLKVFGANGSTSDAVVIAALDYAADPNGDGDLSDQLDVVNLSLGSGYGNPHIMYAEAVKNLTAGGTVVVASAGNSGAVDYIVGSPSVSEEALSVAAGIDHSKHNYEFNAVRFTNVNGESMTVEAVESALTRPLAEINELQGALIYAGLANADFSDELKAKIKGQVALIDRGLVNFADKIKRASEAGAIGVVVANNQPGEPFVMGGEGKFQIPAIMVSLDTGDKIKKWLNLDVKAMTQDMSVVINFKEIEKILKPELIDRLTDFSSKGPRSFDSGFKPEITAPGANIISADMGTGTKGVKLSGTSMSGPHVAGVMALLKQAYPNLTVKELKSIAMGTSLSIGENGQRYPLTRQGSGRVQVAQAIEAIVTSETSSIALGAVGVGQKKTLLRSLELKNLTMNDLNLTFSFEGVENLKVEVPKQLILKPFSQDSIKLKFSIDATQLKLTETELDGWVLVKNNSTIVHRIPVLAVAHKLSNITSGDFKIHSTSMEDAQGALTTLDIKNDWTSGSLHLFNSIGDSSKYDDRKNFLDLYTSRDCDLQAAGYRIVKKFGVEYIQFAAKTYRMNNTWDTCELSVLVDADQDGKPEQELVSQTWSIVPGSAPGSVLLDYKKTLELRRKFESDFVTDREKATENYGEAVLAIGSTSVSNTVIIVDVELSKIAKDNQGRINFQLVLSQAESSIVEFDDYFQDSKSKYLNVSSLIEEQGYMDLFSLRDFSGAQTLEFTKGLGGHGLLLLTPENAFIMSGEGSDSQAKVLTSPKYSN
jgi:minor extracellular serine protease Vpr